MRDWLKRLTGAPKEADATAPAYWQEYVIAMTAQAPSKTSLGDVAFVVFDTETTGLDPKVDRVLSIGAVRVQGGQVLIADSFECLVKQAETPQLKSAEVHGLLSKQLKEGLSESEALESFIWFIGNAVLAGQHVAFDIAMINQMLRRQGINDKLRSRSVDTAKLAIRLEHRRGDHHTLKPAEYSLDALCARYNLPTDDRHTASGDAFSTALLLLKLLSLARKRKIYSLGELVK